MQIQFFTVILFSLLIQGYAQKGHSSPDSSAYDSTFTGFEINHFQISQPQILSDSLIQHREFSALNRISNSLGKSYSQQSLMATTILTNWGAFYLRRMADDSYRQYLRAGNKNQIQKYYSRASRYDDYATAALVVSGAALSAYLWFLFND